MSSSRVYPAHSREIAVSTGQISRDKSDHPRGRAADVGVRLILTIGTEQHLNEPEITGARGAGGPALLDVIKDRAVLAAVVESAWPARVL